MSQRSTTLPGYVPDVSLDDFRYELPEERIAALPLAERDASRLLVCSAESGAIAHRRFTDLPALVPRDALLVLNTTRVVRARIVLHRETGGRIELFLLEPADEHRDPALALAARGRTRWQCMVGGARKFEKAGHLQASYRMRDGRSIALSAVPVVRAGDEFVVEFTWTPPDATFAELLEIAGRVPLPPYIKRDSSESDAATYQTVYAVDEGAVAAPTAGLHFTPGILDALEARGVGRAELTLHVGAGTFRPIKGALAGHRMHEERISIATATLSRLREHAVRRASSSTAAPLVVVGTTSLRAIESLYWFGVRLLAGEATDGDELHVAQWDPYRLGRSAPDLPTLVDALDAVEAWRTKRGLDAVAGHTGIMIVPGYHVRACDALITNFHQPESTLILLVGALLGRDLWSRVYNEALANDYRFLSYGDSSMIVVDQARMDTSDENYELRVTSDE